MAVLLSILSVAPAVAAPVEGTWQTQGGTEVTVVPCGSSYCGLLSWIVIPPDHSADCRADREKFASQMLDYTNPDPALRSRPLVGMQMMSLKPTNNPTRYDVHLYNTQDGKSYDGVVVVDGNTLNLQSCVGICFTVQSWPRVPTRPGPPDFTCG